MRVTQAEKGSVSEELFLGLPVVPSFSFLGEGSPAKIDYRKKGTLLFWRT